MHCSTSSRVSLRAFGTRRNSYPLRRDGRLYRRSGVSRFEFEYRGFLGKRRTVSFGWRYDFNVRELQETEHIPTFLLPLRRTAAKFANVSEERLQHALVTEYAPGAPIGWHRDRPEFEDVIGISLGAPCLFRFRRKKGTRWERASIELQPRSIYLLRRPVRMDWLTSFAIPSRSEACVSRLNDDPSHWQC